MAFVCMIYSQSVQCSIGLSKVRFGASFAQKLCHVVLLIDAGLCVTFSMLFSILAL